MKDTVVTILLIAAFFGLALVASWRESSIHWPAKIYLSYPSHDPADIPQGCMPGTTPIKLLTESGFEDRCIVAIGDKP